LRSALSPYIKSILKEARSYLSMRKSHLFDWSRTLTASPMEALAINPYSDKLLISRQFAFLRTWT
jgi:hypothetical protein